jgi:hypothetical protein
MSVCGIAAAALGVVLLVELKGEEARKMLCPYSSCGLSGGVTRTSRVVEMLGELVLDARGELRDERDERGLVAGTEGAA